MTESDVNKLNPIINQERLASGLFDFWSDVLKLPSIGPMYAFSKDFSEYADDFVVLGRVMAAMKTNLEDYWAMVNQAYLKASKDTIEKSPKQISTKDDLESYRRAMIESFEDSFTELFGSNRFSEVYGKVFSSQLDMSRCFQKIAEKNLKVLNMPTRAEIDEMLKDIHELKKSVRDLKKHGEREMKFNEPAGSIHA